MYTTTLHKVVRVVAVVVSAGLMAPPLFFIAAKKRVVGMAVPVVQPAATYGSAVRGRCSGTRRTGPEAPSPSQ
jgi:ABC-type anion transport system duplicated permease subunit